MPLHEILNDRQRTTVSAIGGSLFPKFDHKDIDNVALRDIVRDGIVCAEEHFRFPRR